jgi:hypothetical protein
MLALIQTLIWGAALILLGMWSLLAWSLQALFTLGSSQAVETALREWLTPLAFMENWVPLIMSAVQSMSQFLATTGDWIPTLIWVIWGLGVIGVLVWGVWWLFGGFAKCGIYKLYKPCLLILDNRKP